jgi:hypothetical protein
VYFVYSYLFDGKTEYVIVNSLFIQDNGDNKVKYLAISEYNTKYSNDNINDFIFASLNYIDDWRGGYFLCHNKHIVIIINKLTTMNINSVKIVHLISDILTGVQNSLDYIMPKWFVCHLKKKKSNLNPLSISFLILTL